MVGKTMGALSSSETHFFRHLQASVLHIERQKILACIIILLCIFGFQGTVR